MIFYPNKKCPVTVTAHDQEAHWSQRSDNLLWLSVSQIPDV